MQGLWSRESVAESPPSAPSDRLQLQMISFSLDPQWCGLLFSVYCRHEKTGLLGPDAFATCSLAGPPLDADWIAFAGSFGFEICRISSTWALIFETVKASGVILLLGVGSLVCYKLYHYYWPRSRSRLNSPNSSPPHARRPDGCVPFLITDDNQLVEDIDEEDINSIEARYFGPSPVPNKNTPHENFNVSEFLESNSFSSERDVPSSSHSESGTSGEEEGRDADVSDSSHGEKMTHTSHLQKILQQKSNCRHSRPWVVVESLESVETRGRNSGWLIKRLGDILTSPTQEQQLLRCGSTSLPVTPGRKFRCSGSRARDRRRIPDWDEEWRLVGHPAQERERVARSSRSIIRGMPRPVRNMRVEPTSPVEVRMNRDESYDSLGFSKAIPREGSFDSTCSEMSLDFSLPEATVDTSTMVYLESLQQEIDQLKNNCLMMDEEFETIKCNRNVPGMSSLMKANVDSTNLSESLDTIHSDDMHETLKQEHARACFAGLYSLTTIKHSTSSELSDSFVANGRGSIGSAESLVWDSPNSVESPAKSNTTDLCQATDQYVSKTNLTLPKLNTDIVGDKSNLISSEDDLMANLEWDEDDLTEYPECSGKVNGRPSVLASMDLLEMDMETELVLNEGSQTGHSNMHSGESESTMESMTTSRSCTLSPVTERSSKVESSGVECNMANSTLTMGSSLLSSDWDQTTHPLLCWSSEESGYMEWDGTSLEQSSLQRPQAQQGWDEVSAMAQSSSSSTSEQSTPVSDNPLSELTSPLSEHPTPTITAMENIGQRINIIEYAIQEWQGQTKKAETILKGYTEIPSILGIQHLRKIRGDNYCGVRAAIFQTLAQGLPVPSGAHTFKCLSRALNTEGCNWLQDWTFAGRLPYQGNNVLHGMENCLRSLDNVASLLSSSKDRQETLAAILNSDLSLDLHIVEAVKLHMLVRAKELHQASTNGADIPLFAVLMFARDTSETPRDLMDNHLREVGNSGGLEQVEMFLLGYTLGVTLRVVRPSAFSTEDFMCFYPDWNVGTWPQVLLVAEDDRHYNVLVD